jgi:hypothetical protein
MINASAGPFLALAPTGTDPFQQWLLSGLLKTFFFFLVNKGTGFNKLLKNLPPNCHFMTRMGSVPLKQDHEDRHAE